MKTSRFKNGDRVIANCPMGGNTSLIDVLGYVVCDGYTDNYYLLEMDKSVSLNGDKRLLCAEEYMKLYCDINLIDSLSFDEDIEYVING